MAKHTVEFSVPKRPLERADIEFVVRQNGSQLGTLMVSKGSLVWFRGKTHKNGEKVNWEEFDRLMSDFSRSRKAR